MLWMTIFLVFFWDNKREEKVNYTLEIHKTDALGLGHKLLWESWLERDAR